MRRNRTLNCVLPRYIMFFGIKCCCYIDILKILFLKDKVPGTSDTKILKKEYGTVQVDKIKTIQKQNSLTHVVSMTLVINTPF